MTSLVFGNFYFDYYSYRFGLEFRLGFGFGLELGLGLRLVLWVRFFSLNYEMYEKYNSFLYLKKSVDLKSESFATLTNIVRIKKSLIDYNSNFIPKTFSKCNCNQDNSKKQKFEKFCGLDLNFVWTRPIVSKIIDHICHLFFIL